MAEALPGVKVGPLDPEATADFGQVGKGRRAATLIRRHTQLYPLPLRKALARRLNAERSDGVDLDEVRDAIELPDGLPDGTEIVAAQVRGLEGEGHVLTYTYRTPSGRSAKWFAEYDDEVLPSTVSEGDRRVRVKDAKEAGVPPDPERSGPRDNVSGGARGQALERRNQELQRRLDELSRELTELRQSQRQAAESPEVEVPSDEPFDGYDELTVDELRPRLAEADQETRDRVAEYERANKNRKSVVAAAERPASE